MCVCVPLSLLSLDSDVTSSLTLTTSFSFHTHHTSAAQLRRCLLFHCLSSLMTLESLSFTSEGCSAEGKNFHPNSLNLIRILIWDSEMGIRISKFYRIVVSEIELGF